MKKENLDRKITYEMVYDQLYNSILTGRFEPEKTLTIRGLAEELGVSAMPIREAIRRLIALGALEMQSTRRITVSKMTEPRFQEIIKIRSFLEPEIAVRSLPYMDSAMLAKLKSIDLEIEAALDIGDADAFCAKNCEFHFAIYKAANSPVMLRLIESLWLQFGPFMRVVIGRLGTSYLEDQHHLAMQALQDKDEATLRKAIKADIHDGMVRIAAELFGEEK